MNIQSKLGPSLQKSKGHVADFVAYLLQRELIDQAKVREFTSPDSFDPNSVLKRLWKLTDLSSHEFANEVSAFFGLLFQYGHNGFWIAS